MEKSRFKIPHGLIDKENSLQNHSNLECCLKTVDVVSYKPHPSPQIGRNAH